MTQQLRQQVANSILPYSPAKRSVGSLQKCGMAQALSSCRMESAVARNDGHVWLLSKCHKPGGRAIGLLSSPAVQTIYSESLLMLRGYPC